MKKRRGLKHRSNVGPGSQFTRTSPGKKLLPSNKNTLYGTGATVAPPVQTPPSSTMLKEPTAMAGATSSPPETSPRVTAAAKGRRRIPERQSIRTLFPRQHNSRTDDPIISYRAKQKNAKASCGTGAAAPAIETTPSSATLKEPTLTTRLASSPPETSPRVTAAAKGRTKIPERVKTKNVFKRKCELRIYDPIIYKRAEEWNRTNRTTGRDYSEPVEGTDMTSREGHLKEQTRIAALIRAYLSSTSPRVKTKEKDGKP